MENACIFILFFNYIFKPPCLNGKLYQINIEWASRNLLHNKKKIISHHGYQGNRKAENLNPIQQCSIGRQPSFSPKTTSQTKHPTSSSIHTGEQHYQPIINSVIKTKYPGIITTAPGLSLNSHFFYSTFKYFCGISGSMSQSSFSAQIQNVVQPLNLYPRCHPYFI